MNKKVVMRHTRGTKMAIYYFLFEAKPLADNAEGECCEGAFVNCWVKSAHEESALKEAIDYVWHQEGWEVTKIVERSITNRRQYEGDSELEDSLECFDRAVNGGIGVILYTWSDDADF